MVRLFVPEGEGQHSLEPRYPDPLPANRNLVFIPLVSTTVAVATTAVLALIGKSRPGTLLKTTAYLSAAQLSLVPCESYGQREVNRAVFKLDNVAPKPGKWWERTKHWTVDDTVACGGVLGTLLSLSPHMLPGMSGWRRFLGMATMGCAIGGVYGELTLVHLPDNIRIEMDKARARNRKVQYERLKQDERAQESLSRFGRIALTFFTSSFIKRNLNPLSNGSGSEMGIMGPGGLQGPGPGHGSLFQQEKDQYTLMHIEFSREELNGPDLEDGYREYRDSLENRDAGALQNWLERLHKARKATATEAQYVWQHLVKKEREFYNLVDEDEEKDVLRRGLQLLNSVASDFTSRDAIFAYHIADARKRLDQIGQKEGGGQDRLLIAQELQPELPANWTDRHSPQLAADHMRLNWTRQKQLLGVLDEAVARHKDHQPEAGSPHEEPLRRIRENAVYMKKNFEATERLLKEFEEQIRRADGYDGK
ncbi:hypothetical protein CC86DRAFT_463571 [Ophiobolus disseminans]|uniref:Uncharacterized protein n=1 Tax=Ophiobolus disseminans TaxID=1469910 RepID=A0A6A7AF37_9PLEO|nr:hypothetical protein CC86DRAFT_463571 [Ophiobolus disseminans]